MNTGRHYIGYDTDAGYVRRARERVESMVPAADRDRRTLKEMARNLLDAAGYVDVEEAVRIAPGVTVSFRATSPTGVVRLFELGGTHTPARPGLSRIDAVWRMIAKAAIVAEAMPEPSSSCSPRAPFAVVRSPPSSARIDRSVGDRRTRDDAVDGL